MASEGAPRFGFERRRTAQASEAPAWQCVCRRDLNREGWAGQTFPGPNNPRTLRRDVSIAQQTVPKGCPHSRGDNLKWCVSPNRALEQTPANLRSNGGLRATIACSLGDLKRVAQASGVVEVSRGRYETCVLP